jgi:hypothetical protein
VWVAEKELGFCGLISQNKPARRFDAGLKGQQSFSITQSMISSQNCEGSFADI